MSKKFLVGMLVFLLCLCATGSANALIINVDAVANNKYNSSGSIIDTLFTAGTYDVTPIGVADGGDYDAWSAWGSPSMWVSSYEYSIGSTTYGFWDQKIYTTASEALAHKIVSSFTLTSDAHVKFYNSDPGYRDNIGGMSLDVTQRNAPVPEPATMLLLGSGLVGLAGFRRKFKR